MCVAIVQNPGVTIPDKVLRAAFAANKDGAGMAFIEGGKVAVRAGYMQVDDFITAYKEYKVGRDDSPFLLHCRIATAGGIKPDNCHPFPVKGGAMIHNGSLFWGSLGDDKSDTREFAERYYERFHKANVVNARQALEVAVGAGNKIAFLYNDKTTVILNERGGDWIDGVWYSNTYWRNRING